MSLIGKARRLHLAGRSTSLIIEMGNDGVPVWRHWGERLASDPECGPLLDDLRHIASFSLDQPAPFSLFPGFGAGWFAQSALLAHRNGRDFVFLPTQWQAGQPEPHIIAVSAVDQVSGIGIDLSYSLDAQTDVLTISTRLTNIGEDCLAVQWLAAAILPLPLVSERVRHVSGRHNSEFVPCEDRLGRGQWRRENRRGLTSHDSLPAVVIASEGCGEHHGLAYGAQLAWSGNHVVSIDWLDDGRYQLQLGEWLAPGEVMLEAGKVLEAPKVMATCSMGGYSGVARNFHAAVRQQLVWPGGQMSPRKVHLNTWEGLYFDHDLDRLKALAVVAADVGIERFVLDDGWFKGRDDDSSSLGDWVVDERKYPDGLQPLADHVARLGMEFGLWVEPEMVNPDSDLFRAHPDWALQVSGRPLLTARNQLVLDLTRADVTGYLFDVIDRLLTELPIGYLKWDHNRDLVLAGNGQGHPAWREQILAAYALLGRIRSAWPQVEIEACAGGGGRIDAGIVAHTHRFWTSDCIDAVSRVRMQQGFLQYMPPEVMGSHIGAAPAHTTGRLQSFDFRAAVAIAGHFGVEFDLTLLSDADRVRLADWVAFYKQWRHCLAGEVHCGTGKDNVVWQACGDAKGWLLFVYRLAPTEWRYPPGITLPFAADGLWRIQRIDPVIPGDRQAHEDVWRIGFTIEGGFVRASGLSLPQLKAEAAAIFRLERT